MATKQRYRVIQRVDVGGMAEIYRGKGVSIQGIEKTVAIKRILPALTKKAKFVTMFLDEARLSMNLNHANIVQVFDVGRSGGTYFIIMEFVEGVNLKRLLEHVIERGERFPVPVALFMVAEACKGLAYAHALSDDHNNHLGVVHRDISPSNILFSWSGEVKITDFGLAKDVTQVELTDPGIIKGKFSYLSPEAISEGSDVDHRADMFSLGTILWEMLAGRRLFVAESDGAILEMIENVEVPSLRKLNPNVPPELEEIVNKALARNPDHRFRDADAFGDAILEILFEKSLKVGAKDVADMLRTLDARKVDGQDVNPDEHIQGLLKEEILNLSMVGTSARPGQGSMDGSRPLIDSQLRLQKLKASSEFRGIWDVEMEQAQRTDLFSESHAAAGWSANDPDSRTLWYLVGGAIGVGLVLLFVFLLI
jgi:eukaryotic-like serine/threonine-protein kinase